MSITLLILLCLVFAFQVFAYLRPRRAESPEARFGFEALERQIERCERGLREEIALSRQHSLGQARQDREELSAVLTRFNDLIVRSIETLSANQKVQLEKLMEMNERKLEQMRTTVDEKLQGTLEKRLGESFKLVSERLELVHKGLGEMQGLAVGVGDLKRVLTNVKTRGSWGEVQLEALLSELLTPSQYDKNVKTNSKSDALVEFAIRLPGRGACDAPVYLPVDSKYPIEDYQRLLEALDKADAEAIEEARLNLERRIKGCAKDINSKYINPPETTDFGIMFLPTEGLYAEVVRRAGLMESLQRDYRVVLSGPATFGAFLNSLQMGFRTLSIEKRSSEVWNLLGAVKTEFGKFTQILDGVKKKLEQASGSMDNAARRSRQIEKKLGEVQGLPEQESVSLLDSIEIETETP